MKSAIEEMYYGTRGNSDSFRYSQTVMNLLDAVIDSDNALRELLKEKPEALKTFETFQEALDDKESRTVFEAYREGFRFGFLLAFDIMKE